MSNQVEGFPKEFSAIKAKDIFNYMTAVNASEELKSSFIKAAYIERTEKRAVDKIDNLGRIIEVPVYDDKGNVIRYRREKTMENVVNGKKYTVFSLTKAKTWFKENYPEAVITKGKRAKESTIFSSWGAPNPLTDNSTQEKND
jgi:hypothetical protein